MTISELEILNDLADKAQHEAIKASMPDLFQQNPFDNTSHPLPPNYHPVSFNDDFFFEDLYDKKLTERLGIAKEIRKKTLAGKKRIAIAELLKLRKLAAPTEGRSVEAERILRSLNLADRHTQSKQGYLRGYSDQRIKEAKEGLFKPYTLEDAQVDAMADGAEHYWNSDSTERDADEVVKHSLEKNKTFVGRPMHEKLKETEYARALRNEELRRQQPLLLRATLQKPISRRDLFRMGGGVMRASVAQNPAIQTLTAATDGTSFVSRFLKSLVTRSFRR
jgi:hypothetical protein